MAIVGVLGLCLVALGIPGMETEAAFGRPVVQETRVPKSNEVEKVIARLARLSGGTVGVSAVHIETGRKIGLNSNERFPMASSYKFPIALAILNKVDNGSLSLSQDVKIGSADLRPWESSIWDLSRGKPITLTLERIVELMLTKSDNTACDVLLKQAGGGAAVTSRIRELGVKDLDVSRSEGEIAAALTGVKLPPETEWAPAMWTRLIEGEDEGDSKENDERFLADPRDTATPDAMVELLIQSFRGKTLSAKSTRILMEQMTATQTGPNRLKGLLPPGTSVAHRTGTISSIGAINDVGVITLPDGRGHIAIAVLMKRANAKMVDNERAIAEIGRTIYDYFVLTAAAAD